MAMDRRAGRSPGAVNNAPCTPLAYHENTKAQDNFAVISIRLISIPDHGVLT